MNKRILCLLTLIGLLSCLTTCAQDKLHGFDARTFKGEGGDPLPYRLFVPENYESGKKYPMVLWMHGGAGRGTDNRKQISGGNKIGSTVWTKPENQSKNPAFVLAAQFPRRAFRARDESRAETNQNLKNIVSLIASIKNKYNIDPDRIYVAGQSFGGYGTWWMIAHNPRMFAAAVPICGGGEPDKARSMKDVAIWAFHGAKDRTVSVERSREMIKAIEKAGGKPKYTEYKNLGHVIWNRVFANKTLIDWMFKQRRKQK